MIHLVYPHRARIFAPDVIGRTLLDHFGSKQRVQAHDFDRMYRIEPQPGDILIGHAHPVPWTVFRRSARRPGWARRILLEPFNADWQQVGFIDDVIDDCDLFLAITGRYWFETIGGPAARWKPKMIHLDLAVDRDHYPVLRRQVAPPGTRKFIYIGNDHPGKNLGYLDRIAARWTGGCIDWAGRGKPLPNVRSLGFIDFSSDAGRRLIADYDFLITVGSADANPTTVLEAMAWGLVPVCTPTSGYIDEPSIINIPSDDVEGVCKRLDQLQEMPEAEIVALRARSAHRLDTHFRWDRFVGQVDEAIRSGDSPLIAAKSADAVAPRLDMRAAAKLAVRNLLYGLERRVPGLDLDGRLVSRARAMLHR